MAEVLVRRPAAVGQGRAEPGDDQSEVPVGHRAADADGPQAGTGDHLASNPFQTEDHRRAILMRGDGTHLAERRDVAEISTRAGPTRAHSTNVDRRATRERGGDRRRDTRNRAL